MKRDLRSFVTFRNIEDGYFLNVHEDYDTSFFPASPGAYVIASPNTKFIYPNGNSKVYYIGKSNNLKTRIADHCLWFNRLYISHKYQRLEEWYYSRYQYGAKFGANIYWFTTRGLQDPVDLELKLMSDFYDRYFAIPVGNGAFSFGRKK